MNTQTETSRSESRSDKNARPCPNCGGTAFTHGQVPAYGQMRFVKTAADAGQPVRAQKCDQCGNVQLFAAV